MSLECGECEHDLRGGTIPPAAGTGPQRGARSATSSWSTGMARNTAPRMEAWMRSTILPQRQACTKRLVALATK